MQEYVKSIISNLYGLGERLDKTSLLLNHPWILLNHPKGKIKYIFQKGGEMIISQKGNVTKGRWELLEKARSLYMEYNTTKLLLNKHFLDPAVLLFKKDGDDEEIFTLINENIIPDHDLEKYLNSLFYKKHKAVKSINVIEGGSLQIGLQKSNDYVGMRGQKVLFNSEPIDTGVFNTETSGFRYYIKDFQIDKQRKVFKYELLSGDYLEVEILIGYYKPMPGDESYINGKSAESNRYEIKNSKKIIEINDGKISRFLFRKTYPLKNGDVISVIGMSRDSIKKGNEVFLNGKIAPDGLYKIAFWEKLKVKNGRVV